MLTTLRYSFVQLRGQILGWGLGLAGLGMMLVGIYDSFAADRGQAMLEMIKAYPPEFLAFFGGDATSIVTPQGYLGMYGFAMLPPILGIFGVLVGSGLLAVDEEQGRLDLVLAHPVSRAGLFWGRLAGFVAATLAISVISWLGFSLLLGRSKLPVTWGEMALPFLPLAAQVLCYGALALLLSSLLPSRSLAAAGAGLVMVGSYLLSSLARMMAGLSSVARLLPYEYYQGGDAIKGIDGLDLVGLLVASAVMALLAWWRFERRDVRVVGEGGWRLPARKAR